MTTPQPDPIVSTAQADRDHVAALAAAHEKTCTQPGCETCVSLAAHLERAERQVQLLTPPEVTEESLF